ncbi:MAG TPA: calcium/proton exchanger [Anaerolineales bacterium]|nr:calcium/proton exchanger [Anaerolineales bacterium]
MKRIVEFMAGNPWSFLLAALPLTAAAQLLHWSPLACFILAALGIIPLAAYIGGATEDLAAYTNPRLGALLNATFGNAAELIITIAAVRAGLTELVKASISGSIIGNLLFVLGASMLAGGLRHGMQTFNKRRASRNAILLVLAVVALIIPSAWSQAIGAQGDPKVEALSLGVAIIMLLLYALGLMEASNVKESPLGHQLAKSDLPGWTPAQAVLILVCSTLGVLWLSETLVNQIQAVMASWNVSEFFLGIILVPIIGNVAEHLVSVQLALKNKMELSVEVATSSSLQIALFVAPLLVFISLLLGHPLQLTFNRFELLAVLTAVVVSALVSSDGESTWLEGAGLLAVYLILGLGFFLLP